jgi:hypothetical protein
VDPISVTLLGGLSLPTSGVTQTEEDT